MKFNILAVLYNYREKPQVYKVFPKMNIRPHKNGFLKEPKNIFCCNGPL
jgi:hypothetical protein